MGWWARATVGWVVLILTACSTVEGPQTAAEDPRAAVEALLEADRAFSAASSGTDVISGLSAMFDEHVVMPLPSGTFARTRAEATEALRSNPANAVSGAEWTPVRGGISADGQHGFTYGYMTIREDGKPPRPGKYLSYWIKRPEGWRVAAYKRTPRPEGDVSLEMMPPALPDRLVPPTRDPAVLARHRATLDRAERDFSEEAQRIGLGPAFEKYGSADAMNMGREAGFTIGAEAIGAGMGDEPTSPVSWAPDDVLVASSGDLGITWGIIRSNRPPPEGQPAIIPYSTIWRRASPDAPWRYVAE